MILLANICCWTPFMVERLLYAWEVIDHLPSVIPAILFLLGHTHNLLRGIFYVFNHAEIRTRVSAMSTSAVCTNGCISLTASAEDAYLNPPNQSSPLTRNMPVNRNALSRASLIVPRAPLTSSSEYTSSVNLQDSSVATSSTNSTPLPNMVSHT
ncbi:hypothetical protein Hamer_G008747 [Homarus americanus]|uniref:Uncharacterized protein n=2 Tax=Homarus americanus TaxID=6706 RepID=A0A8J5JKZ9_HOMAM|nr:hypothetical protein Hamer_G008747 [Homarus americanus]